MRHVMKPETDATLAHAALAAKSWCALSEHSTFMSIFVMERKSLSGLGLL